MRSESQMLAGHCAAASGNSWPPPKGVNEQGEGESECAYDAPHLPRGLPTFCGTCVSYESRQYTGEVGPHLQGEDEEGRSEGEGAYDAPRCAPITPAQRARLLPGGRVARVRVRAVLLQQVPAQHACAQKSLFTKRTLYKLARQTNSCIRWDEKIGLYGTAEYLVH